LTVIIVLAAALGAWGVWLATSPVVVAVLEVRRPTPIVAPDEFDPRFDADWFAGFKESQLALITSRQVVSRAVPTAAPEDMSSPALLGATENVASICSRLSASYVGKSDLLKVQLRAKRGDIDGQVRLLDDIVNTYLDMQSQRGSTTTRRWIELLEAERDARQRILNHAFNKLEDVRRDENADTFREFLSSQELAREKEMYEELSKRMWRLKANLAAPSGVRFIEKAHVE
jgi:hypothetical protein